MASAVKRCRELGILIRAAQGELGAREMSLIEKQECEVDRAKLDVHIANLECQMGEWKREQESLFRDIAGKEETGFMSSADFFGPSEAKNVANF